MHFLPGPLRCYARPGFVLLGTSFRNPRLQERLKVFAQDQTPAANFRCAELPAAHELVDGATGNSRCYAGFVDAKRKSFLERNFGVKMLAHLATSCVR
jgi:hypothetical protein